MSRLLIDPVRSLAHGSIAGGGVYTAIGTSLTEPVRLLLVQNHTDAALMFSFDGTNNHFPLLASTQIILDITSNRINDAGLYLAEGRPIYVTQIGAPTTGSVYVTVFYARN